MIAVVIRGQYRTWNFCKQQLFHVFETRYTDVHWHFVTWQDSVNHERQSMIEQDFHDKQLHLTIINREGQDYNSWSGQRRLGMEVAEKLSNYPTIFELRPDVFLDMNDDQKFPDNTPNTLYVTGLRERMELVGESGAYKRELRSSFNDWFYIQDGSTLQKLSRSFYEPMRIEGPRVQLLDVARQHDIDIQDISDVVTPQVIRPTYLPHALFGHEKHWMGLTRQQKKDLLNELNIAHQDYITNNRFISL